MTAASAIAALQEAGSKLSRDMLKSAYRAFAKECYLVIELMRQFYDEQRVFRILGPGGGSQFIRFSGAALRARPAQTLAGVELAFRVPVFDILVSAAKNPASAVWSRTRSPRNVIAWAFLRPKMRMQRWRHWR